MKKRFVLIVSLIIGLVIIPLLSSSVQATTALWQDQPVPVNPPNHRVPDYTEPPVSAAAIINPVTAQNLALAMGINATELIAAETTGSDPLALGIGDSPLTYFPTQGNSFALLSTGFAGSADTPNDSSSLSYTLNGLNNSQGQDLVQLTLRLRVPNDKNCMKVDLAFYSEEFPEYVGSSYNDTFTAELGGTNLSIDSNEVVAPLNFAFDTGGGIISVNTAAGISGDTATTYDGATPLLTAKQKVPSGQIITVVFSVQDLGDSIYDSTVFLDNFRWSNESDCESGSQSKPPLILVHGYQGRDKTDLGTDPDYCTGNNVGDDIVQFVAVKNNLTTSAQYWGITSAWFDGGAGGLDDTPQLYYDVWIAQLKSGETQGTPSMLTNARCLIQQINYVYGRNRQPVTIVAHSMGGLVSRATLLDPEIRSKVKALYTIHSPHAGLSKFSGWWACGGKQVAPCEMQEGYMNDTFNYLVKNQRGISYFFLAGDHTPALNVYLGSSARHDGLVGYFSAIGWNTDGVFEPTGWPNNSLPGQFWVDEVHSRGFPFFIGPIFGDYRVSNGSVRPSQSYRCIKYWMDIVNHPFSVVPDYCRIPSNTVATVSSAEANATESTQVVAQQTGHLDSYQTVTHDIPIDSTGTTLFSLSWTTGTLNFHLVRPGGQIIDPAYAAANPQEVRYEYHADGPDAGPTAGYVFTTTTPGLWQMVISAADVGTNGTKYDVFTTVATNRILTVEFDQTRYDIGNTATLSADLQQTGAGMAGATLVVDVFRSDGIVETISFTDQGNGNYVATYTVPNLPGFLPSRVTATGIADGLPFARQVNLATMIIPNDVEVSSAYADQRQNDNNDSLYERLDFPVQLTGSSTAPYTIIGELAASGQTVAQTVSNFQLGPGEQTVVLSFNGNDIRTSQLDGPYTLARLSLIRADLGVPAHALENVYTTAFYRWQEFGGCHTLTIVNNPSFGGAVNLNPPPNCNGGTQYSIDTAVELSAAPNQDYIFTNWIADATGVTSPIQVTIDGDKTVAANFLEITWGAPAVVTLATDPLTLTAGGSSVSTIMATVTDATGNIIPLQSVAFATTLGTLNTNNITTNPAGVAIVALTASTTAGIATITASADAASDSITVTFLPASPATVTVAADPISIIANGVSTTLITVSVKDAQNNPTPDQLVTFETTLGNITASATTDANGNATATLTSATSVGNATVTATTGTVSGNTTVNFVVTSPAAITVTANASTLPANGTSTSTITAVVKDAFGHPVPNRVVNFVTNLGTVVGSAITNASGTASVTLTSAATVGTATITASTGSISATTTVTFVFGPPASITISAVSGMLPANGTSTSSVTAVVKDAFGNPVPNQIVTFATNLGTIVGSATTDATGTAVTTLTAAAVVGTATITASTGPVSATTTVTFVGNTISGVLFLDLNRNGVKDVNEGGIANAQVIIMPQGGGTAKTTTTASNGTYTVADLPPGNYVVTITPPAGFALTTRNSFTVSLGISGVNTPDTGAALAIFLPLVNR